MEPLSWPLPGFTTLRFDNTFSTLPPHFYEIVEPTPLKSPELVCISEPCARDMGIETKKLDRDLFRDWLNGTVHVEGEQRLASCYAGHQFGVWAGQLGDGRALSIGEFINFRNDRFEIQTKGSGQTPFSRMGDGKAVIRSSVREFLCSEAMHALRIPTTRALALITGRDSVQRETVERSALIARVFPTNIRFGHFEHAYHFDQKVELAELIDYTRNQFFPDVSATYDMLYEISLRTADMIAQWQAAGFCHGVMNTDNMSVLGLTLDYGPFGFIEDMDLNHVCNHSDREGRYSYSSQPLVAQWNLERFLVCFSDNIDSTKLEKLLSLYQERFEMAWTQCFRRKLGLSTQGDPRKDVPVLIDLLKLLHARRWDFTYFFRQLCNYEIGRPDSLENFFSTYERHPEFLDWLKRYDERLKSASEATPRAESMRTVNPKYVLKNYIANEIIEDVETGSSSKLNRWMQVLTSPFDEHPQFETYSLPTPGEKKDILVSCSS